MPSISIALDTPSESSGGGPLLAGVTFRRPSQRTRSWEPVSSVQELANGSSRTYYRGKRLVVTLAFSKLTDSEVAQLEAALSTPYVTYQEDAEAAAVVVNAADDALTLEAIPGTYPVRHNATVTLKARDLVR